MVWFEVNSTPSTLTYAVFPLSTPMTLSAGLPPNAPSPIDVTLRGMVILVRPVAYENAQAPIEGAVPAGDPFSLMDRVDAIFAPPADSSGGGQQA